ncbi:MAG TPA: TCR/Tet family MFS transporter [Rhizomicrobium sp.]|jgi:DHA1 family tetracycline resistance protein-like MFS transporter|nr:TCR/Tet family MFS transporter [Rhizomicrobium sp.]
MSSEGKGSRLALTFIFITMLIDTIGLGIIIPVSPGIIAELTHQNLSGAARWGGWLFFAYALMQFLCAPLIGNLSDRFGRRPVLILSLGMLGVDYLITGLAPTIAWLFIGRVLSGGAGAAYPTANAYIADISPPERRAANFGLVGAAFGVGFVLGPALGGFVGEHFGLRAPFFVAAGISFANALFGLFVLHESLPPERRRRFEWWRANPLGALKALSHFPQIAMLLAVLVLVQFAHDSLPSTWTYYTMLKFGWGPGDVAWSLVAIGILTAISFAVLPRLVVPRVGEKGAVYVGFLFGAAAYLGYAIATKAWMFYAWMIPFTLGGVGGPALNAIMSHSVPATEQGELQGASSSINSMTSVIAMWAMPTLFAWFTGKGAPIYFPGASFFAAAVCELGALLLFARAMARGR